MIIDHPLDENSQRQTPQKKDDDRLGQLSAGSINRNAFKDVLIEKLKEWVRSFDDPNLIIIGPDISPQRILDDAERDTVEGREMIDSWFDAYRRSGKDLDSFLSSSISHVDDEEQILEIE